jgi:uncharacterized protein (TIGR00369 family)
VLGKRGADMTWIEILTQWARGDTSWFGQDYTNLDLPRTLTLDRHEPGAAFLTWRPDNRYCHRAGAVTGGYVCVVADMAANAAMITLLADGQGHVTPDLRMTYFRPFKPGVYSIEARVINTSKVGATVEVTFVDGAGRLTGKASVTEAIRSQTQIGLPGA